MAVYNLNVSYGSTIDNAEVSLVGIKLETGTKLRMQHVEAPESYTYVFSYWYKVASGAPVQNRPVIGTWDGGVTAGIICIHQTSSFFSTAENAENSQLSIMRTNTVPPLYDDTWHHIIISEKSYPPRQQIFVDGIDKTDVVVSFTLGVPFQFQDIWALFNDYIPDGGCYGPCPKKRLA